MDDKQCLLVIIGAAKNGKKELVAIMAHFVIVNCPGPSCRWVLNPEILKRVQNCVLSMARIGF